MLVTEEHPRRDRRAHPISLSNPEAVDELRKSGMEMEMQEEGDGTVLVVHAMLKRHNKTIGGIEDFQIDKMSVCSGFILNVKPSLVGIDNKSDVKPVNREEEGGAEVERGEGAFVMTCAHTLEEVRLSFSSCSEGFPVSWKLQIGCIKASLILFYPAYTTDVQTPSALSPAICPNSTPGIEYQPRD